MPGEDRFDNSTEFNGWTHPSWKGNSYRLVPSQGWKDISIQFAPPDES
jgi:hypothetical protein